MTVFRLKVKKKMNGKFVCDLIMVRIIFFVH